MKRTVSAGAVMLISLSSAALAQTTPGPASTASTASPTKTATAAAPASGTDLQQQLTTSLQQSGFTDVKVKPDAFIVQAKDQTGAPVTVLLNANSVEILADEDSVAKTNAKSSFTSVPANEDLSSKLIGLDIYNGANKDIGTIKDVAFSAKGVKAYIVGVGGFIGMDEHYVAIRPSAITINYDSTAKKWHAAMETSVDELKAAPEYKYPGAS
jgi:sporulation protein YlmC with PRC-barrel domain